MKRLAEFARSVVPVDPFQLLFLGGVVCLLASHGLGWSSASRVIPQPATEHLALLWQMRPFFVLCILFSAMSGYFLCFWPGKRPLRRVIWLVCAPALLGLGLFTRVLYLITAPTSVLDSSSRDAANGFRWTEALLLKLPEGFHFAFFGLILIVVFASRMAFGIATLPVVLPDARASQDSAALRRLQILIFLLVGPLFLAYRLANLVGTEVLLRFSSHPPTYWFRSLLPVLGTLAAYLVLLCFMRREERDTTWNSMRRLGANDILLAVVFPVGIYGALSLAQYLPARMQWAAHEFGKFAPPQLETHFSWPDPWLFLLFFFAALCEELIFRGLLQPRFIQRYGLYRGIFLVGIVWAAFHFFSDFSFWLATDVQVIERLGSRLFLCVTLSFVFGWLTLRSKSVLPATVAHALYNVLVTSSPQPSLAGIGMARSALWGVLAYILFRYWPVRGEDPLEPPSELLSLENALPVHSTDSSQET